MRSRITSQGLSITEIALALGLEPSKCKQLNKIEDSALNEDDGAAFATKFITHVQQKDNSERRRALARYHLRVRCMHCSEEVEFPGVVHAGTPAICSLKCVKCIKPIHVAHVKNRIKTVVKTLIRDYYQGNFAEGASDAFRGLHL